MVEPQRAGVPMLLAEDQIFGDGIFEDEAAGVAIFGYVRETGVAAVLYRETRNVAFTDRDGAAANRAKSGDRLEQLSLPVSFHARDAEDLTGRHRETHVVDGRQATRVVDDKVSHLETRGG